MSVLPVGILNPLPSFLPFQNVSGFLFPEHVTPTPNRSGGTAVAFTDYRIGPSGLVVLCFGFWFSLFCICPQIMMWILFIYFLNTDKKKKRNSFCSLSLSFPSLYAQD